jgi:hypothetical protein
MSEHPEAADLLDEARRSLLEALLPLLPQDRRYDALMVANAMAIASREARSGDKLLREEVRGLEALLDEAGTADGAREELQARLPELERRLALDIRRGSYDAAGPQRDAVRAYLRTVTREQVRISNPKALAGS